MNKKAISTTREAKLSSCLKRTQPGTFAKSANLFLFLEEKGKELSEKRRGYWVRQLKLSRRDREVGKKTFSKGRHMEDSDPNSKSINRYNGTQKLV